jgi:D-galactarolactone cycloisomerase
MKIAAIDFFPLSLPLDAPFKPAWLPESVKARNGTLVRLRTDDGTTGFGWVGSRGSEVKEVGQSKFFQNLVIGLEVYEFDKVVKILSRFPGKLFGIEVAMWDALGKSTNRPIYQLLGGVRDRVMAYASTAELKKPEEHAADALKYWDMGFHAIKTRIHSDRMEDDVAVIRAMRKAVPPEMLIMVDANQANPTFGPIWSYKRALKTAREFEKLDVYWLEEPLHHEAHEDLAQLRSESSVYIAGGEDEVGMFRFKDLLTKGCFDIVQPDVCGSGGILEWRKIATLAESMSRMIAPHSFDTSINLAASLQAVGSVPNASIVEYAMELPALNQGHDKLVKTPMDVDKDGFVRIPNRPGLGIEIDETVIEKYSI